MGIIEIIVKQSGNPSGRLGRIMVKIMNFMDSGINKWVIEKVNQPDGVALEIGCGGGETMLTLLKEHKLQHITGIDSSIDSINVAKKKNHAFLRQNKADILLGNVTALPFPHNSFDIIFAVRSHYFWDDLDGAFSEIYRTLKQGGTMVILSEQYKIHYHMKKYNTDTSMTQFLTAIGFHNIDIENKAALQCITAKK